MCAGEACPCLESSGGHHIIKIAYFILIFHIFYPHFWSSRHRLLKCRKCFINCSGCVAQVMETVLFWCELPLKGKWGLILALHTQSEVEFALEIEGMRARGEESIWFLFMQGSVSVGGVMCDVCFPTHLSISVRMYTFGIRTRRISAFISFRHIEITGMYFIAWLLKRLTGWPHFSTVWSQSAIFTLINRFLGI